VAPELHVQKQGRRKTAGGGGGSTGGGGVEVFEFSRAGHQDPVFFCQHYTCADPPIHTDVFPPNLTAPSGSSAADLCAGNLHLTA